MAFTEIQRKKIENLKNKNPHLSIRDLKELVLSELNLSVSVGYLHKHLFFGDKETKSEQKNEHSEKVNKKSGQNNIEIETVSQKQKIKLEKELTAKDIIIKIKELRRKGFSLKQIAAKLNLRENEVRMYIYQIREKYRGKTIIQQENGFIERANEKNRREIEKTFERILSSLNTRTQVKLNILNTLYTNLQRMIMTNDGKPKDLSSKEMKELSSHIYALSNSDKFLYSEFEAFFKVSSLANLNKLYQDMQENIKNDNNDILDNYNNVERLLLELNEEEEE